MMSSHPETRSDGLERDEFIEDEENVSLILQALGDKEWGDHFMDLKGKIQAKTPEMPTDIKVQKIFANLRGLCWGTEAVTSLTLFEGKYYDMEQRIKTRSSNRNCSTSSESTVDLAVSYVSEVELSDTVGLGCSKNFSNKFSRTGCSTPRKQWSTHPKHEPNKDTTTPSGNRPSSPYSNSDVLKPGPGGHGIKLSTHLAPPRSSSNHYVSPSTRGSSNNLGLETFSPDLSPVKYHKDFGVIRRDKSPDLTYPHAWKESEHISLPHSRIPSRIAELPSRLPFLKKKETLAQPSKVHIVISKPEISGFARQESGIPVTTSTPSFISKPTRSPGQDKALPPLPRAFSSPGLRQYGFKGSNHGDPTHLKRDVERGPRETNTEPRSTLSSESSPLQSSMIRRNDLLVSSIAAGNTKEIDHQSFQTLSREAPIPAGELLSTIAQDVIENGAKSSRFPTKISMAKSESSTKTVTQSSNAVASTILDKVASADRYEPSVPDDDFDSDPGKSGRRSRRCSTTLSSITSYEDQRWSRDYRPEIYSPPPSETKRPREVPRIVNIVRNSRGIICVVPADDVDAKQIRLEMSMKAGANSTTFCANQIAASSGNDFERSPFDISETKKTGQAVKKASSHESVPKITNSKQPNNDTSVHENCRKAQDPTINVSNEHLNTRGSMMKAEKTNEIPNQDAGVGCAHPYIPSQNPGVHCIHNSYLPKLSLRPRVNSTSNQKNNLIPRTGSTGQRTANTGGNITGPKNTILSGIERIHIRPPVKDITSQDSYTSLDEPPISGSLWAAFSGPSPQPRPGQSGGQLQPFDNRRLEPSNPVIQSHSKIFHPLNRERNNQHGTSTETPSTPVEPVNKTTFDEMSKAGSTGESTVGEARIFTTDYEKPSDVVLVDITEIGAASNPRISSIGYTWFVGAPTMPEHIVGSLPHPDYQKENSRLSIDSKQHSTHSTSSGAVKSKSGPLENFTTWLSRGPPILPQIDSGSFLKYATIEKSEERSSPATPHGEFSQDEVENLIRRLSTQIPQTPGEKNAFHALGGRYYTSNIPSLDKSPSKDEKKSNPIAVCMDLINAASNEPESPRREKLLQMSRVMVDAVSKSRDAECAAEEAEMAAKRAEAAFLETRKYLAQMTELMKNKKHDI